jgi:hypothetical protein
MSDDLVSVLWTSSLVEAEIAKGRLEAESIPVQLRGEGADAPYPLGPAELLVPPKFEEEAPASLRRTKTDLTGPEPVHLATGWLVTNPVSWLTTANRCCVASD